MVQSVKAGVRLYEQPPTVERYKGSKIIGGGQIEPIVGLVARSIADLDQYSTKNKIQRMKRTE